MRIPQTCETMRLLCFLSIILLVNGFVSPRPRARISTHFYESTEPSLWQSIDKAGQGLKPKAVTASEKAGLVDSKLQKVKYVLLSSFFYTLFIVYRAYRGFFVLLPAVFREVYKKMERAVDSPFDEGVNGTAEVKDDSKAARLGTRVTVGVLASLLTLSFLVAGAFRVAIKFFGTILSTSNVAGSFAAAAEEQEENHKRFSKYGKKEINGSSPSDLAP